MRFVSLSVAAAVVCTATLAGAQLPPSARPAVAPARDTLSVDRIVAVVGDQPILWSDVLERISIRRRQGLEVPTDSAGQMRVARQVLDELIDEDVLVQRARAEKIELLETELNAAIDQQIKQVRSQFASDGEFETALKGEGFGTRDEYRRFLLEQARRAKLQERVVAKLRQEGKLIPVAVSETDVTEAFEKNRAQLGKRPATVAFRQIVVAPRPSDRAKAVARAKAESLLVDLKKGADFALLAKRESMDSASAQIGGDLGWNRRDRMVPEFERWMFALPPGQLSPVVETQYGFHIIRVDRVQPGEVKARHILVRPRIDSADVAAARLRADTVLALWQKGTAFDSLVARYHDRDEEKGSLAPFPRDSLPPSYATAFSGKRTGDFVPPFAIGADRGRPKFVVARVIESHEAGDYTVADVRNLIRDQLSQERAYRRLIDQMRASTFVSIRL